MLQVLTDAASLKISAATWLEAHMVMDSFSQDAAAQVRFYNLMRELNMQIVAVDEALARIARAANLNYGRGRRHPARLNFGDCFSYVLAKQTGEPLLSKGNDFSQTDIVSALA